MLIKSISSQIPTSNKNSFKSLYVESSTTYEALLGEARDPVYGDRFAKAFQELNEIAEKDDIQIAVLNKGACITRIDPKTQAMLEVLAVNIEKITLAVEEAVHVGKTGLSSHYLSKSRFSNLKK